MLAAASIGLFSARLPAAVCCSEQLCRILDGCAPCRPELCRLPSLWIQCAPCPAVPIRAPSVPELRRLSLCGRIRRPAELLRSISGQFAGRRCCPCLAELTTIYCALHGFGVFLAVSAHIFPAICPQKFAFLCRETVCAACCRVLRFHGFFLSA